jgi:soluble lytic murein transglycosylase-like protein
LQAQSVIIDVGCLQVNLYHHPTAFVSLNAAFDPATNIAYAAKFLNELKSETGDWDVATQYYHSRTPYLGEAYGKRVARAGGVVALAEPVVPLSAEEKAILRKELGNQLAASDELIARSPALRQFKPPTSEKLQHLTSSP